MHRRQFLKGAVIGTAALVLGVDLAAKDTKDVSGVVEVTMEDDGTMWVSRTSNDILRDVEALMDNMKDVRFNYEETIVLPKTTYERIF